VPVRDPLYEELAMLDDVQPHFLLEVEHFFEIYKDLEGAQTKTMGWRDRKAAHDVITDSIRRYNETYGDTLKRVQKQS
jgi:inorganic pyrophosphatase